MKKYRLAQPPEWSPGYLMVWPEKLGQSLPRSDEVIGVADREGKIARVTVHSAWFAFEFTVVQYSALEIDGVGGLHAPEAN